ncbi:thiamine pyrophosphate-dependent enzyme [Methylomonas koyamae]|uniref:thiamine pyrophosphate-dependent enzyme n=1 Tax=Methylomonas koyamae TaxID=702114 RepID=UPI000AFE02A9|nr:thiamine pyrophosphate-dependent enzyme [Methylomonas koyamae]
MEISQQSTDQAILAWARDDHGKPQIALDPESLYRYGHLIRLTEQLVLDQFSRGLVSGTTHTCIGQELTAMSVVRALNHPDDAVLSNHRNHGHFLTYSGDLVGLVAEIMGREAAPAAAGAAASIWCTGIFTATAFRAACWVSAPVWLWRASYTTATASSRPLSATARWVRAWFTKQ